MRSTRSGYSPKPGTRNNHFSSFCTSLLLLLVVPLYSLTSLRAPAPRPRSASPEHICRACSMMVIHEEQEDEEGDEEGDEEEERGGGV
eukprot:1091980-Rhodomonas_salina.2